MTGAERPGSGNWTDTAGHVTAALGVLGLIGSVLGIGSIPSDSDTFTGIMVIAGLALCPLALILGLGVRRKAEEGSAPWSRIRLGLSTASAGLVVLAAGAAWITVSAAAFTGGG